jgi:hypothetical protein
LILKKYDPEMTFYKTINNHKDLVVDSGPNWELDFYKLPINIQEATTQNAIISIDATGIQSFIWHSGIWLNGIFDNGLWKYGTWLNGEWKKGIWQSGIWRNGIWYKGTWYGGTWHSGRWIDGTWLDGNWCDGHFIKGYNHLDEPIYGFDSLGKMIL